MQGFFHADPHGGNLLATADGKLVYLDFGMMSEVCSRMLTYAHVCSRMQRMLTYADVC
jgi:predicted unusual protein kinase regulating ubiquinone biosynthesis (AarF/ABC1/UbiB family)